MSGRRNLAETLPSPSELDEFDHCYFAWLMKYRQGVERIQPKMGLIVGKALDNAINAFYNGASSPLDVYNDTMRRASESAGEVASEEWNEWHAQGVGVVNEYLRTIPRMAADWLEIVAVQKKFERPAPCRPDLIVRMKAGHLAVLEGKMESALADLEYENLKYEMSWQVILYPVAVMLEYGEPVKEVIMEYRQRGMPAKGRYKERLPVITRHSIPVEPWKPSMWARSAMFADEQMAKLEAIAEVEGALTSSIPRRTAHCIKKFGTKTFPCEFFPSCSMNMHPLDIPDLYEIPEWKKEAKS